MGMMDGNTAQWREMEAEMVLRGLLAAGTPLFVAFSAGKDSTSALALTLNAAVALKRTGATVPPIIVTHGDTGIENPSVSALAHHEMEKVRQFGRDHGLVIRAEVATPALNDTWAVSVLSGRKLPTFANSSSRDCTVAYKIAPMVRLRKRLLAEFGKQTVRPVTIIGTRFEESAGRSVRMQERQESHVTPWEKDGQLFISPIAEWTSDDVWETLGRIRAGEMKTFTDGAEIFDLYAAGGGTSCAIVGDMATESAKKSRACGARFGCSLCAAVGRDKSLESMLESDPSYAWLRGLNTIQRFLVDTQYDFDRRNWLGRSIDDKGYLPIVPDTYSPAMLKELLRYCLSVDADEVDAARAAGLDKPRFQLVSAQAIVAIDALWGLHGLQDMPFQAVAIWREIHNEGKRFYPPANAVAYPVRTFPQPKYIFVGESWDQGAPAEFNGLRDGMLEMHSFDGPNNRMLKDGREVMQLEESSLFEIDARGAEDFLAYEADFKVAEARQRPTTSSRAFYYYVGLGVLSTSKRHVGLMDSISRRANWRRNEGLAGDVRSSLIKSRAMTKAERDRLVSLDRTIHDEFVGPYEPIPLRMKLCSVMYL